MGNRNLLFESIFNRKFSGEDIRSFLEQVTKDHPYFSPAQYFLLLQADKDSSTYAQQVAKTSVLFNNPHWLKFQLDEYERNPAEISNSIVTNNNELVIADSEALSNADFNTTEETTREKEDVGSESVEQGTTMTEQEDPAIIKDTVDMNIESDSMPNEVEDQVKEVAPELIAEQSTLQVEDIPKSEEIKVENEINEIQVEQIVEEASIQEDKPPVNEDQMNDDDIEDKELVPEIKKTAQSGHFNNDATPLVNEVETEEDIASEKEEIEPLNFRLNIDTSLTTEDTISFEPLHTTDYFASLGIKLSGEIQTTDKLGKQLKSFTEWLKTMKKIHNDQQAQQNGQAEITVQKLAENSNKLQEVVTESMADVFLQQGKAKRAIEVYKKLSLLDSSKSAYFAAKIDQLKEH